MRHRRLIGLMLAALFGLGMLGCGGGGGTPPRALGSVEGYVYVPTESGGALALFSRAVLTGYQPVPHAEVTATVGTVTKHDTTDAQGFFRIEGLPEGRATITIKPPLGLMENFFTISTTLTVVGNTTATIGSNGSVSLISHTADRFDVVINQVDTSAWPRVRVYVSVVDPITNSPVLGLTSADFALTAGGASLPVTVRQQGGQFVSPSATVLVLDQSGSMEGDYGDNAPLNDLKSAANLFIQSLQSTDVAQIVSFASTSSTDTEFTNDTTVLTQAVNALVADGATALYDGIWMGLDNVAGRPEPRKAVIAITDGGENSSSEAHGGGWPPSPQPVINHARSLGVPIYTIGLQGYGFVRSRSHVDAPAVSKTRSESDMRQIAVETGGEYFYAPTSTQLQTIYTKIVQRVQHPYIVEFMHTSGTAGQSYTLNVTASANGLTGANTWTYTAVANWQEYYYSQVDPRWASDGLPNTQKTITIGGYGCLLSSMAMQLKHAGATLADGEVITPATLNNVLSPLGFFTATGEYTGGVAAWGTVPALISQVTGGTCSLTRKTFNQTTLNSELDQGRPVIVHLPEGKNGHWVLVIRRDGNQYYVNDPGKANAQQGCNIPIENADLWSSLGNIKYMVTRTP